jgi:hypothetical protein
MKEGDGVVSVAKLAEKEVEAEAPEAEGTESPEGEGTESPE